MKACTICAVEKDLSEFNNHNTSRDGKRNQCRECRKKRVDDKIAAQRADPAWRIKKRAYNRACMRELRDKGRLKKASPAEAVAASKIYRETNRMAVRAQWAVKKAIKSGRLDRLPCEVCGDPKSHAHHRSYAREDRLKVVFLCAAHHHEEHVRLREEALLQSVQPCPSH